MSIYWEEVQTSVEDTSSVIKVYKPKHSELRAFVIEDKDAINYPKLSLTKEFEPLVNNFGIYFLYSKPWKHENIHNVYVGRASKRHISDNKDFKELKGMQRLKEHIAKNKDGTYHDNYYNDWDSAVFITTNDRIGFDINTIVTLEEYFIRSYKNAEAGTSENNSQTSKVFKSLNNQRGNLSGIEISELDNTINAIKDLISMRLGFGIEEKYNEQTKVSMLESEIREKEIALKAKDKAENKQNNNTGEDAELLKWAKALMEYNHRKNQLSGIDNYVKWGRVHNINNIFEKSSEVITPDNIAEDMVNLIPETVFTAEAKFLDPACKSGIFIIKVIEKLMSTDPNLPINKDDRYRDPWDRLQHILTDQVYGLCVSYTGYMYSMSQVISYIDNLVSTMPHTKKDIVYNNTILPNIIKISNYTNGIVKGGWKKIFNDPAGAVGQNYIYSTIKEKFKMDVRKEMKFDVVIGNPPYNNDMYLDFVQLGHQLSKQYTCMITPAKWQAKGGKKNEDFRKIIVPYMSRIVFYPCTPDVFDITSVGGITFFLLGHDQIGYMDLIIKSINSKSFHGNHSMVINKSSRNTYYSEEFEQIVSKCIIGNRLSNVIFEAKYTGDYMVSASHLVDDKQYSNCVGGYILTPLTVNVKAKPGQNKYTLFVSTKEKCLSFKSYVDTKLVRFLVALGLCASSTRNAETWRFVPDPGAFDHIFTDQELYQKYGLTKDEITIIESVIKERK